MQSPVLAHHVELILAEEDEDVGEVIRVGDGPADSFDQLAFDLGADPRRHLEKANWFGGLGIESAGSTSRVSTSASRMGWPGTKGSGALSSSALPSASADRLPKDSPPRYLQDSDIDAMMVIMRYPEGHSEAVKERIVHAASRALRRHGLEGVSIPALMKQVGLTHGGFYTHFKNRDELVAEAIRSAAAETAHSVFSEGLPLEDALDRYLSKRHVEHPEAGCVLAALGTDGARQPARVRRAFAEAALGLLRLAERKLDPCGRADALSDAALVRTATMIGAVILARLVRDVGLAERILAACRVATST